MMTRTPGPGRPGTSSSHGVSPRRHVGGVGTATALLVVERAGSGPKPRRQVAPRLRRVWRLNVPKATGRGLSVGRRVDDHTNAVEVLHVREPAPVAVAVG